MFLNLQYDGALYTNRRVDSWGTVGGSERERERQRKRQSQKKRKFSSYKVKMFS